MVIELEDGYRIGRIPFSEAEAALLIIAKRDERFSETYYNSLPAGKEKKKFSYLRSLAINKLIHCSFDVFLKNYEGIISFEYDNDLIGSSEDKEIGLALSQIKSIVRNYIYKWQEVLSVEATGFEVLGGLLSEYIEASNICISCSEEYRSKKASKIFDLLPEEYQHDDNEEPYLRYLKIASYVSGMTDTFAINLFQRIKGIKT